jgi:hypothetical protein
MEDPGLWLPVFGWEYPDNEAFEQDMVNQYWDKIHPPITPNEGD